MFRSRTGELLKSSKLLCSIPSSGLDYASFFYSATEAAPRTTAAPIHIIQSDAAPVFGEAAADEEELLLELLEELLPPLLLPVSATTTTGDRLANLAVTVLAAASKLDSTTSHAVPLK